MCAEWKTKALTITWLWRTWIGPILAGYHSESVSLLPLKTLEVETITLECKMLAHSLSVT